MTAPGINRVDVHQTHCCVVHGCKYGDDDCPVVTRTVIQTYRCESCDRRLPPPIRHHDLKTDPEQFEAMWHGLKHHDVRSTADREFAAGDVLILREFDRDTQRYSGRELRKVVSYITPALAYGIPRGTCVLSLYE